MIKMSQSVQIERKQGDPISDNELMQKNIEEFARLQDYMIDTDKESVAYKKMKRRYIELKVILTSSGVNLTELDIIKEVTVHRST